MALRALVVRRARIGSVEIDLRVEGERIVDAGSGLPRAPGESELDARGADVLATVIAGELFAHPEKG